VGAGCGQLENRFPSLSFILRPLLYNPKTVEKYLVILAQQARDGLIDNRGLIPALRLIILP
jgi:hypothetical protein